MNIADEIANIRRSASPLIERASDLLLKPPTEVSREVIGAFTTDVRVTYALVTPSEILDIRGPVAAVGLTGLLLPGSYALVVPSSRRQVLAEFLAGGNTQWWGNVVDIGGAEMVPPEITVLYPGDVLPLGRLSEDGVSVHMSPGRLSPQHAVDPTWTPPTLRPEPYIRVFRSSGIAPHRIGYRPVPAWVRTGPDPAPSAGGDDPRVLLGGVTHVRITFQDDVANTSGYPAPVQGVETGDYEIYWLDFAGIWIHHADDDFDAAGRGAVTAAHCSELYTLSVPMHGLRVVKASGNDFLVNITAFDAGAFRP